MLSDVAPQMQVVVTLYPACRNWCAVHTDWQTKDKSNPCSCLWRLHSLIKRLATLKSSVVDPGFPILPAMLLEWP